MVCKTDLSYFQTPREAQTNKAKAELGEDDNRMQHAEGLMEDWIRMLPYFPKNYDKSLMRNFLRFTKHNMEKAKEKFEFYHVMKNLYPQMYSDRDPLSNEITQAMEVGHFIVLPNYTENCERIHIMRLGQVDINLFHMPSMVKMFTMLFDLVLTTPHPISSEILIVDAAGFTAGHFAQFMSQEFRTIISLLRKVYPVRLSQVHIVNGPPMIEKMVNLVKLVLHEKIKKRFTIHKTTETLLERFSEKVMPKEYGGFQKSIKEYAEDCLKMMQDNAQWYQSQEDVKITEDIPKHRETLGELSDQIGLQGSFRQLSID